MTSRAATREELAAEWREFDDRARVVAPEALEGFLHAVRWWSVSRDPEAMRALTAVSRAFPGPLTLEYYGPRLADPVQEERVAFAWAPLFATVFAGCTGRAELRALPSKAQTFVAPDDHAGIARFLARHQDEDVYFGVATRAAPTAGQTRPGALESCCALGCLFADLDYKTLPEPEARERLARFTPAPALIVASGGGLHCYWPLAVPIPLPGQAAHAKRLLRQLAQALGGDLSAAEPARVLRVPGSVNHKYEPARLVTIERGAP